MTRVAHVIVGLGLGGAERMLVNLLHHQRGVDESLVMTMTEADDLREDVEATGTRVVPLGMRRGVPDPRALAAARRVLRSFQPDVVQTWMYHADLLGGLAARSVRVPVVWDVQSTVLGDRGGKRSTAAVRTTCARLSGRLPARIVACAESAKRVHVDLGYAEGRMVVIPNGVDTQVFAPDLRAREEVRSELGLEPDVLLVGNVARFHPYKDHASLIRAVGDLVALNPQTRLVLMGTGMDAGNEELTRLVSSSRLADRTILLGPRRDVARLLPALDVFVLSSTEEALPNAVLEAMACEVPVVATDVGDCRLVIGDTGALVPPGHPEALAAALNELFALSPDVRRELGRRARERVRVSYSIDVVAGRYVELWREVAAT